MYLFIFILILLLLITLFVLLSKPKEKKVYTIKENIIFKKQHLNKNFVLDRNNLTLTFPNTVGDWNGVITIKHFVDHNDIMEINYPSDIRIVEYNNSVTNYGPSVPINGYVHHYQNSQGSVHLNNYDTSAHFDNGVVHFDIKTIIADQINFS